MTLPRATLVNPCYTPYYHCVSRCVRRAYLCGRDRFTGNNFDHRRRWIESRLLQLADIFSIDVCAYAVMSNHYHVVLHINVEEQAGLSDDDIVARWQQLHRLPDGFDNADNRTRQALVTVWRQRLGSISWFMKCVNEPLARFANRQDDCKGRFWEGRFKSQALLDEAAVLKCMAYVDLNPVRASIAETPEDSAHTSIQARIEGRDQALAPTSDSSAAGFRLPVSQSEYLLLVDWTGRQHRSGKRGHMRASAPPIVQRLERASRRPWLDEMRHLTHYYFRAIGNLVSLADYREHLGQTRLKGLVSC